MSDLPQEYYALNNLTQKRLDCYTPSSDHVQVARIVGIYVMLQMMFSTNGLFQNLHRQILFVTVQQETVRQVQIMTFNHLLHLKYEWHVNRFGLIKRSLL